MNQEVFNYFGIFHKIPARYSELCVTTSAVDVFVAEGKMIREHMLPFDGKNDSLISIAGTPDSIRESWEKVRLEYLRGELRREIEQGNRQPSMVNGKPGLSHE